MQNEAHTADCAIDALAQMLAQLQSLSHISNHQLTKTSQERRLHLCEEIIEVVLSMKRQLVGEGDADVETETAKLRQMRQEAKMLDAGLRTLNDLGDDSDSTLQGPVVGMNAEEVQRLRTKLTEHPRGASGNDM